MVKMSGKSIKNDLIGLLPFSAVSLVFCICSPGPFGKNTPQTTLADFKLSNEIQGWKSSSYTEFVSSTLYLLKNGMDDEYTHDSTLIAGFKQILADSVKHTNIEAWVMDFGTPAAASAMYHKIKPISVPDSLDKFKTNPFSVPPYDSSVAIARPVQGGVTAYAHFDKYYFELSNSGYAIRDSATADMKLFLEKYQSIGQ